MWQNAMKPPLTWDEGIFTAHNCLLYVPASPIPMQQFLFLEGKM